MKMSEINLKGEIHKVIVREYERGYGQRDLEKKYFDNKQEALAYCQEVNADNTCDEAPDSYIKACYEGKVS